VALGSLSDSDGKLDIAVTNGSLGIVNTDTINVTSLTLVGDKAKLLFSADPSAGVNTKLVVSGATNIATGAELGIRLANLVAAPTSFLVIQGNNAQCRHDRLRTCWPSRRTCTWPPAAPTPTTSISTSVADGGRDRHEPSEASAYDAVFAALGKDSALANTFLNQTTKDGFRDLYDQMLPDQGEGLFAALQSSTSRSRPPRCSAPIRATAMGPTASGSRRSTR
jgi:hypothetical protein